MKRILHPSRLGSFVCRNPDLEGLLVSVLRRSIGFFNSHSKLQSREAPKAVCRLGLCGDRRLWRLQELVRVVGRLRLLPNTEARRAPCSDGRGTRQPSAATHAAQEAWLDACPVAAANWAHGSARAPDPGQRPPEGPREG